MGETNFDQLVLDDGKLGIGTAATRFGTSGQLLRSGGSAATATWSASSTAIGLASSVATGLVSTGAQSFGGAKTFNNSVTVQAGFTASAANFTGAVAISAAISASAATFTGNATVSGTLGVQNTLTARSTATFLGNATISGTLTVQNAVTGNSNATYVGTLHSDGNLSTSGTLAVTGTSALNGNIGVDGNITFAGSTTPQWISNLGITFATSTLRITQASGSALSTSAFGFVTIPATTSGLMVSLKASRNNYEFVDSTGTSDISGIDWGTDGSEAWSLAIPFYIMAINRNDTSAGLEFAITRDPTALQSPGSAAIGFHGTNPATDDEKSFFFLTSSNISQTHQTKPCVRIGGVRMIKDSSDDWAIQTLAETNGDGVRQDPYVNQVFAMKRGQNGGNASSSLQSAGTVPTWVTVTDIVYNYRMSLDGWCDVMFQTNNAGNATNGAGTNALSLAVPYSTDATYYSGASGPLQPVYIRESVGGDGVHFVRLNPSVTLLPLTNLTGAGNLNDTHFSDGLDDIEIVFRYKAF